MSTRARHRSPNPTASTASTAAPTASSAASSPSQQSATASFLSEDLTSASTSADVGDNDSLADASPEEVEARAMEFINNPDIPPTLTLARNVDGDGNVAHDVAVAPSPEPAPSPLAITDIPRKIPTHPEEVRIATKSAEAYLRSIVDKLEETDWMYDTPPVFRPPAALDLRRGGGGMGDDESISGEWMDQAFNLDAYPNFSSSSDDESEVATEGLRFLDLGNATMATQAGTMYLRDEGEVDHVGAGFGGLAV